MDKKAGRNVMPILRRLTRLELATREALCVSPLYQLKPTTGSRVASQAQV